MSEHDIDAAGVETFFASNKSVLAKSRIYIWFGLVLGMIPVFYLQVGHSGPMYFPVLPVIFALVLGLIMEIIIRKQLRPGQPLVTLTAEFIEAPNLTGSTKRLFWVDVDKISLDAVQGTRMLSFQLMASMGVPHKRSFWTGNNPGRPILALTPFSPECQEQLLDATKLRHEKATGRTSGELGATTNELKEEREFQEKLKALQPHPWITYGLISINVLIWLLALTQGANIINTPADKLFAWGGNAASEVQRDEWWRMLSAIFLHSNFLHVAMNMLGLYSAGVVVERIYGPRLFLIVYFGAGLMGSALSLHFSAQQAVSVGASGAVFGVTGALLVAVFQHRDKLPKVFSKQTMSGVGFFILYSLMQGFKAEGIDNAAHMGGLMGGCLAAIILPARFDITFFRRVFVKRSVIAVFVLTAVTISLAAYAPQAKIDQGKIFASNEMIKGVLKRFDKVMLSVRQEVDDTKSGKISEQESDRRSRTIFAPMFRGIVEDLSQVAFRPGDPREPFVKDIKLMSELLAEALAMESVLNESTQKYDPVDRDRADKIAAELAKVSERISNFIQSSKKKR